MTQHEFDLLAVGDTVSYIDRERYGAVRHITGQVINAMWLNDGRDGAWTNRRLYIVHGVGGITNPSDILMEVEFP